MQHEIDARPLSRPATGEVFDVEKHTDWAANAATPAPIVYQPTSVAKVNEPVNPVTGHGLYCQCSRCPGWYDQRAANAVGISVAPPPRRSNVLLDQVVPVSILMAVFTICAMVLVPVIMPLVGMASVISIIGLAVTGSVVPLIMRNNREEAREARRRRWWR